MTDCLAMPMVPSPVRARIKHVLCGTMLASSLALGACSGASNPFQQAALTETPAPRADVATGSIPRTDLQKATEYWGKQFEKDPRDAQAAINYVRNLKALDAKPQAFQVIQQAYTANPNHRGIASEYGRLALDQEQVSLAEKLLAQADDPVSPDWKLISARGTVFAKQGKYHEAIPHFERALALAPTQASVLNNLALAYAMDGHAEKAEPLLRQAALDPNADPKVAKNLALVLGLQGKPDEAKSVVLKDAPAEEVAEDASFVKAMVGSKPAAAANWTTAPIKTSAMAPAKTKNAAKTAAKAVEPAASAEDAAILVQRLADGYTATPSDAPMQLVPKP